MPSSPSSIRVEVGTFPDIANQILVEELRAANFTLCNPRKAEEAVAKAITQWPTSLALQIDNRRDRPDRTSMTRRPTYKSVTGRREVLRRLVLEETDPLEKAEESSGRLLSGPQQLRCYGKQIVKLALRHNSFWAAIGVGQVLCDYSAGETIDMYDFVARERASAKYWSSCTKVKKHFHNACLLRFGDRMCVEKEGRTWKIKSRPSTPMDVRVIKETLDTLLPPLTVTPPKGLLARIRNLFQESTTEMENIHRFLDMEKFNQLVENAIPASPKRAFEERFVVPIIGNAAPDDDGHDGGTNEFDLDRVRQLISTEHRPQRRVSPGALRLFIDDIDCGELPTTSGDTGLCLDGASCVKIIGANDDGEQTTIATYLVTYDAPVKCELWQPEITENERFSATFEYCHEESVLMRFEWQSLPVTCKEKIMAQSEIVHPPSIVGPALFGEFGCGKSTMLNMLLLDASGSMVERCASPQRNNESPHDVGESGILRIKDTWALTKEADMGALYRALYKVCTSLLPHSLVQMTVVRLVDAMSRAEVVAMAHALLEMNPKQPELILAAAKMPKEACQEIDHLTVEQSRIFNEFAGRAGLNGMSVEPGPRVHPPGLKMSRVLSLLSLGLLVVECVLAGKLATLLGGIGGSSALITVLAIGCVIGAGSAAVALYVAWKYRWSLRLSNRYNALNLLIDRLQRELGYRRECLPWRDINEARVLFSLLKTSDDPHRACCSARWLVNTSSVELLTEIIGNYRPEPSGNEERTTSRIARAIVERRPITSSKALLMMLASWLEWPDDVVKWLRQHSKS